MDTRKDKVKLGIFALATILVGGAIVVLLVGLDAFSGRSAYEVFYTTSVVGLAPGSNVTINGVTVGHVTEIGVDPDNVERIRVGVEVNEEVPIKSDTKAYLSSLGITGLKYIDLQGGTAAADPLPAGSEIPSGQGLLDRLTERAENVSASADQIFENVASITDEQTKQRVDRILVQAEELTTNANAASLELARTLAVVRGVLERNEDSIDRTIRNVGAASGELRGTLAATRGAMVAGQSAIEGADLPRFVGGLNQTNASLRAQIESLDPAALSGAIAALQELVVQLVRGIGQNQDQLRVTLYNMRRASDDFKDLSRSLREKPSRLVFDSPPEERELP